MERDRYSVFDIADDVFYVGYYVSNGRGGQELCLPSCGGYRYKKRINAERRAMVLNARYRKDQ